MENGPFFFHSATKETFHGGGARPPVRLGDTNTEMAHQHVSMGPPSTDW